MISNLNQLNQRKVILHILEAALPEIKKDLHRLSHSQLLEYYEKEIHTQHPHCGLQSIHFQS
ncbi:hypothetical protein [uncultured Rossellomorea sp.]|uniref:hypothetical protein n=1 Tax=uncultured Rossellomorea sp. TaxID=2837549 RepID=UPI00262CE2EE|nr:hypothetical protein [uncultured Rossellomorea sp.]